MIRSLYSGVSGLTTHQTRMDVIGNNIANVNTYGFKASRTTFRDIFYQTAISNTAGRNNFAGNNASEVGYGVQLGSIDKNMSQSGGQGTERVWDMMINGSGFFITATFSGSDVYTNLPASDVVFTRNGNFGPDSYGNLVTANNSFVVGTNNNLAGLLTSGNPSLEKLDKTRFIDRDDDGFISSSDVQFRNAININELIQSAFNVYTDNHGFMYGLDWDTMLAAANAPAAGTNGLAADGLVQYDIDLYPGSEAQFLAAFPNMTLEEKMQYLDLRQTLINLEEAVDAGAPAGDNAAGGADAATPFTRALSYRYYCDEFGERITLQAPAGGGEAGGAAADAPTYTSLYTALDAQTMGTDAYDEAKGALEAAGGLMGMLTYSNMKSVNVGFDGVISVTYNSKTKSLAQIKLAVFDNVDGLLEDGMTCFRDSAASGMAQIKNPGDSGVGTIKANYLEMSNVNLANEFSDMIVTQRGFQANARIITTSDSMLEELVNLKR